MPEGIDLGGPPERWQGRTYYGRPQLKPSPFSVPLVGGYVFLAGLSGAAALLATLLDLTRGRAAAGAVRQGRYLALLAPTAGAICLIADLHTPQRFYNMLRVFKRTSPMSFGSWLLVTFGVASGATAASQYTADRVPGFGWMRWVARVTQLPAAVTGGGLATYTAALFSATSTPLWAAAPRALAVRFAAAAVASAAAALGLGQRRTRIGRDLDGLAVAALMAELAATLAADEAYRRAGVAPAANTRAANPPSTENVASSSSTRLGVLLPLGLQVASLLLTRRRSRGLAGAASLAVLGGSLAMRCGLIAAGDETARRPEISLHFTRGPRAGSG